MAAEDEPPIREVAPPQARLWRRLLRLAGRLVAAFAIGFVLLCAINLMLVARGFNGSWPALRRAAALREWCPLVGMAWGWAAVYAGARFPRFRRLTIGCSILAFGYLAWFFARVSAWESGGATIDPAHGSLLADAGLSDRADDSPS